VLPTAKDNMASKQQIARLAMAGEEGFMKMRPVAGI
jgi:hypothetical protein